MTPVEMPLAMIRPDADRHVRGAVDEAVVANWAALMLEGVSFPAIVVFYDDAGYYVVDGFHRYHATVRAGRPTILAEPHFGNRSDALWFALGAHRIAGRPLTVAERTHAIALALEQWGDTRTQVELAAQLGVSTSTVSSHVVSLDETRRLGRLKPRQPATHDDQRAEIVARLLRGESPVETAKMMHVHASQIFAIKRELGLSTGPLKSRSAVAARRAQMRELAADHHTSRQIAAAVGLTMSRCRHLLQQLKIDVPADRVTGKGKRHDATRIIGAIVMDAANLTEGVDLIDFAALDRGQLAEWLRSLQDSRDKLGGFIRRLMKEQQYGDHKDAQPQAVESAGGADCSDARAAGARGAA